MFAFHSFIVVRFALRSSLFHTGEAPIMQRTNHIVKNVGDLDADS
jgi:hypothetical protein